MSETGVHQRLAAILAADAAGYSRLMATDEQGTMAALDAARGVFRSQVDSHHGRVIDMAGDSVLALFETATGAVSAALAVQAEIETRLAGVPADRRMRFRIGIHLGDVIEKADGSVYGDGVNIAARLEGLAQPGGITVSDAVQSAVRHRIAVTFEDLGEQQVKNIVDPVRAFRVVEAGAGHPSATASAQAPASFAQSVLRWRWWVAGTIVVVAATVLGAYFVMPAMRGSGQGAGGPPLLSLAVLPFKATGGAADEMFAESFTRDLTAALGRSVFGSPVISNNTLAAYRGKLTDARTVGKDLNVRYLVEGEVARNAGQVVVGLALVDALNAKQVWNGRIETPAAKVSEWPELPVLKATLSVRGALNESEQRRLANQPVRDAKPLELVFRALMTDASTREGLDKEKALCEKALHLDPELPETLICKVWTISDELSLGPNASRAQLVKEADDLSRRAVALSGNDAMAWLARGDALQLQNQWEAALGALSRTIQLDPSRASALVSLAFQMIWTGRPGEALPLLARASDIDPNKVGFEQQLACRAYLALGRYDEAIASCERSASKAEHWLVHIYLAAAYAQKGDTAKAVAAKNRALTRKPEFTIAWARTWVMQISDNKLYHEQFDKYFVPGLRKAGFAEK